MGYGQKVFHLPNLWPTKDAYVFMVKILTVIANQKKKLESDLLHNNFLNKFTKYKSNQTYNILFRIPLRYKDYETHVETEHLYNVMAPTNGTRRGW